MTTRASVRPSPTSPCLATATPVSWDPVVSGPKTPAMTATPARPSPAQQLLEAFELHDPATVALISQLDPDGRPPPAEFLAGRLGLRHRYALSRFLSHRQLPSIRHLHNCLRVLQWVEAYQTRGTALCRQALQKGRDPAAWYRTVTRTTGRRWSELRHLSTEALAYLLCERWRGGSQTQSEPDGVPSLSKGSRSQSRRGRSSGRPRRSRWPPERS